jgi:cysteine desulfurase
MKRIYLDHSATTPLDPRVRDAMLPYFTDLYGNPSSIHAFGREARAVLEESRDQIARSIGARSDEVFFTSGGTEADNHALQGVARAARRKGKNHIVISAVEHHAVLHSAAALRENGFGISSVPVDRYGKVDPAEVQKAIKPETCLVSIMHANNEVGTINDLEDISVIAKEKGVLLHSDTVQTVGKIKVDVNELGVGLLAISAHKFYGPKGIGAIYIRRGTAVESLLHGGSQESNRRAGTENVPLAVGFAKALELCNELMDEEAGRLRRLRGMLQRRVEGEFKGIIVNSHPTDVLPNILSVSFDSSIAPLDGEALIMGMDLEGVAVTSGSACTSGSLEPSHVLHAMGRDGKTAKATIRFSLGRGSTEDEIDSAVDALHRVVSRMEGNPRS